jgi:glutathione peroxidase
MLASGPVPRSIWDISVTNIGGRQETLDRYRDHVLLIVNVASRCGYTSQYKGLEALYRRHRSEGLVVLGFPCNQFGHQEPGTDSEIAEFCALAYDITFPLFARIDVNGLGTHSLYRFLKTGRKGLLGTEGIKWNFTKFLVDRAGRVVDRFGPADTPESIEPAIVRRLAAPVPAANT